MQTIVGINTTPHSTKRQIPCQIKYIYRRQRLLILSSKIDKIGDIVIQSFTEESLEEIAGAVERQHGKIFLEPQGNKKNAADTQEELFPEIQSNWKSWKELGIRRVAIITYQPQIEITFSGAWTEEGMDIVKRMALALAKLRS